MSPSVSDPGGLPTDRPQVLNDPILTVRGLRRFEFVRSRPEASADRAVVLLAADGSVTTYGVDRQPTRGELVVRNLRTLYEVDVAHHHQYFEYRLPSQGDAFFFQTEVDVSWFVAAPETVVRRGVRDVRATVEPALRRLMTKQTRLFAIEDNAAAEEAVNRALDEARIGADFGLRVDCAVRLGLDSDALEHFASLRRSGYGTVQAAARHLGAKAASEQEHEIIQAKVDRYNELFRQDDNLWALMLARNPDDLPLVLEGRRADERQAMANRLQLIQKMIDAGQLEDHMLEEPTQLAIKTLREILANAADGTTTQRPLYKQQLPSPDPNADHQLPPGPDDDR
ncbi:hypothetical protein F1D05_02645 [Kribbella qitaiheensis]|uniref:SPFH domain-containing protein n=1 Tax=Kribbella qitaiheensis TaxID=1544730 RepID=A0A7G6WSP4_9ACTN|nr:hypothetical protein [Kribbella qitaiheensis]QNE17009.1 hypothetical protein F1D05_02645 [Kribbella qitaiheensis]